MNMRGKLYLDTQIFDAAWFRLIQGGHICLLVYMYVK